LAQHFAKLKSPAVRERGDLYCNRPPRLLWSGAPRQS